MATQPWENSFKTGLLLARRLRSSFHCCFNYCRVQRAAERGYKGMKRAGKEQASISCWKAAELGGTHGPPRAAGAASGRASCHPETCTQSEDRISLSIPGFATKPWVICGKKTCGSHRKKRENLQNPEYLHSSANYSQTLIPSQLASHGTHMALPQPPPKGWRRSECSQIFLWGLDYEGRAYN